MIEKENIRSKELNEQQLLSYLKGNLSAKENHAIEENMITSNFVNDAVEGLQSLSKNEKLEEYVKQLNKTLQHQLKEKKYRKQKRKIKGLEWAMIAIAVILAICFAAYEIIISIKK